MRLLPLLCLSLSTVRGQDATEDKATLAQKELANAVMTVLVGKVGAGGALLNAIARDGIDVNAFLPMPGGGKITAFAAAVTMVDTAKAGGFDAARRLLARSEVDVNLPVFTDSQEGGKTPPLVMTMGAAFKGAMGGAELTRAILTRPGTNVNVSFDMPDGLHMTPLTMAIGGVASGKGDALEFVRTLLAREDIDVNAEGKMAASDKHQGAPLTLATRFLSKTRPGYLWAAPMAEVVGLLSSKGATTDHLPTIYKGIVDHVLLNMKLAEWLKKKSLKVETYMPVLTALGIEHMEDLELLRGKSEDFLFSAAADIAHHKPVARIKLWNALNAPKEEL